MRKISRLLLLLSAAQLLAVLFLPIWRIELDAPQYPEGLALSIHADGLKGDVEIINGLNHYIGMKTLHNEDFWEFRALPYILIGFSVLFLLTAAFKWGRAVPAVFLLFVLFGVLAIYDFWRWEYDYGHNLDPNAAIKVPGMAYQPPLIGFKQLLNFGAYSIPDAGGWLVIAAGVWLLVAAYLEWGPRSAREKTVAAVASLAILGLSSCSQGVEQITAGRDVCHSCKMGISDKKYSAALLTTKGRTYKFDDIVCLSEFVKSDFIPKTEQKEVFFSDFSDPDRLLPSGEAFLLESPSLKGPMRGHVAAFSDLESLREVQAQLEGEVRRWKDIVE